jgi:DNA recombination protein RmuC
MLQAVIAGIAVLAGVVFGILIRGNSAKAEKASQEQHTHESVEALASAHAELARAQAESDRRAGFESLAGERDRTIVAIAAERDAARGDVATKADTIRAQTARISQLEADLNHERQNMAEKIALLETAKQALANQFEALAGEILEKKSKSFSEGSQKEIGTLLTPLREQIKEFRERVEKVQTESTTGVTELKTLIGTLGTLNQALTEEAHNLTTALRGSAKTQGDWGEFILRDLLDKAGLREGEQYSFQQNFAGVEGENGERSRSVRTDVIVFLPGGRNLVIDSKVSLVAYTDCVNATCDDDRKAALRLHLASVRAHMAGLSRSGYHRLPGVEAPDFVVMFVPVEPAFLMALQNDAALWSDAYEQGILLVGPTTLLYVIRIVNVLWQQELQARSVQDVMNRGTALYEKFVGFVGDLEAVGKGLRTADQSYVSAMKKLVEGPGNLVRQVEMLKKLGIRTSKALPRTLLDQADVEEAGLALAAEGEEGVSTPTE